MNRKIVLFTGLLLFFRFAAAQTDAFEYKDSSLLQIEEKVTDIGSGSDENLYYTDTSLTASFLNIAADSVRNMKAEKRYSYINNLDSALREYQKSMMDVKNIDTGSGGLFDGFLWLLQPFLWLAAILLVLFVVYRLFLSQGLFKKSVSKSIAAVQTEEEILLGQDYDALIAQSKARADFRLATRFWFLKTLQRLSDREHIVFAVDKTNSAYVREVPPAKQQFFAHLVLNYEYVWYGHKEIAENSFAGIEKKFNEFFNTI